MPFLHISPIRCLSCTILKLVLRHGFPLDMLSAVLRFERSYPALPLARQLEHQRFTIPGPLVQRNNSLSFLHFLKCITPKKDRIRTVSQRTKPNSRTAFIGEQPNPWELLHPQDAMSRHRGAKPPRRYELLVAISLLSPEYLLSVKRRRFHFLPPDH